MTDPLAILDNSALAAVPGVDVRWRVVTDVDVDDDAVEGAETRHLMMMAERRRRLSATRDVACRPNVESRGVRRAPRPIIRGSTRVEAPANQGGGDRIRTDDFRRAKAALCQLSYAPWGGAVSH